MSTEFLQVKNLSTKFEVGSSGFLKEKNYLSAVSDVSFSLKKGEVLGLVGESGCGKSTLGRSILQLIRPSSGQVLLDEKNLVDLSESSLRRLRPKFQMIFQDPYASLNPRMTVFDCLSEPLLLHGLTSKKELPKAVQSLMDRVGLSPRFIHKYPHEFSGGQRQRIAIARALASSPELIIADEPVSALDVSIQSQILNLLMDLQKDLNLTMIFISHDLSVVRLISDRIAVMYLGKIVEIGDSAQVFDAPLHPYTQALLSAVPLPDPIQERKRQRVLLSGDPPSPMSLPNGCFFHPRCPYSVEKCQREAPSLRSVSGRDLACLRAEEIQKN